MRKPIGIGLLAGSLLVLAAALAISMPGKALARIRAPAFGQACQAGDPACATPGAPVVDDASQMFIPFLSVPQAAADDDDDDDPTPTATATQPASTPTATVTQPAASPTPTLTPPPGSTPTATATPVTTPPPTPATPAIPEHAGITRYEGPKTCLACHAQEGEDALHTVHLQWKGPTPYVPNLNGKETGKWEQINTYCTAPAPADPSCRACHATTGKVENLTVNDVDCLTCHQDQYQRSLGPQTNIVEVVDWTGTTRTFKFPVIDPAVGDYQFQPRYDLMPAGTTMEHLAQTVHLPTRATCLRCHAKAGGGDGTKRGDLSTASTNPTVTSDVHMSPQGGNLLCQDCHQVTNHQIAGRGIDLRESEGGPPPLCTDCHAARPHDDSKLNTHTDRVACQTCHIPTFGKDVGTEMARDWTKPVWNPAGCQGQGAWVGEEVRAFDVKPEYRWWNGYSYIYDAFTPIQADPDGVYTMARALGSIQDGKLYPVKVHYAYQPRHDATGDMVMYDVLWNFMTGKADEAAARRVTWMGLSGSYSWVTTRAEQLITHGVEPAENALGCSNCHSGGDQMNLPALGYALKGTEAVVCTQCHEDEDDDLSFEKLHKKHVTDKRYDCAWCHTFTRPERGLRVP